VNGLPVIRAVRFYEEVRAGSSLPLLVGGDDGNKYVVKLNGAGDGVVSNVVEWVSSKLGGLVQIPVLQPVLIAIDTGLADEAGDPETRELLERSAGINLGTPYLPEASAYSKRYWPRVDDFLKQQIFLFDLFLLNVDRTEMNPNMIIHHGDLWCLDYSSAMEIRGAINSEQYREHKLLKHLKRHPFYGEKLAAYGFVDQVSEIQDDSIRHIVDEIPAEWIGHLKIAPEEAKSRSLIKEKLIRKKPHARTLLARLDLLRVLKVETEEEARLRTLENKKSFERKYGRL
jgi:hypothetical protein